VENRAELMAIFRTIGEEKEDEWVRK
jgi:hypothetical protein